MKKFYYYIVSVFLLLLLMLSCTNDDESYVDFSETSNKQSNSITGPIRFECWLNRYAFADSVQKQL